MEKLQNQVAFLLQARDNYLSSKPLDVFGFDYQLYAIESELEEKQKELRQQLTKNKSSVKFTRIFKKYQGRRLN